MKPADIGYLTEGVERKWSKELDWAVTLQKLRGVAARWGELFPDAAEAIGTMDEVAFTRFRTGLQSERKGAFAGQAWARGFGAILIPEIALRVSGVANRYQVPWGTAYIRRLKESNLLHGQPDD